MDPLKNIINLIENNDDATGLASYLGIGEHNIDAWKNGDSKTYILHLKKIAEYFGVSTNYLLGKTDEKEPPNTIDRRAVQLLTFFDKLNDLGKQKAVEYLCDISSMPKYAVYVPSEHKNIGYTISHDTTRKIELSDEDIAEISRMRRNIKNQKP